MADMQVTKYQPRLLSNPDDVNSEWQLAVWEISDDNLDLFDTAAEARQAGLIFVHKISNTSISLDRNLKCLKIVRINWSYE